MKTAWQRDPDPIVVGLVIARELVKSHIIPDALAEAAFERGGWDEHDNGWQLALECVRDELAVEIEKRILQ